MDSMKFAKAFLIFDVFVVSKFVLMRYLGVFLYSVLREAKMGTMKLSGISGISSKMTRVMPRISISVLISQGFVMNSKQFSMNFTRTVNSLCRIAKETAKIDRIISSRWRRVV